MRRALLATVLPVLMVVAPGLPGSGVATVAAAGATGAISCGPSPIGPASAAAPVTGFNPMTPLRLIDTRTGIGGPTTPLGAGCVLRIETAAATEVPTEASALSLSVTSVDNGQLGFLTVYPCGGQRPGTSNINTRIGVAAANNVVAALDSTRAVCIYASTSTHLVVDLFGWYGSTGMQYVDIAPVRALDTRPGGPRPPGGSGRVRANTPFALPLAAQSIPGEAEAVLVNLTVAQSVGPGFLVAYPCGSEPPLASNVNFLTNEDRAGSTMVGLGPDGALCLLSNVDVHVIVDVNGYFVPDRFGPKTVIQPFAGRRIVDSRDGTGGWSTPMAANEVRSFDPTPDSSEIDNTYAATLNVIATEGAGAGHLRLFPCGGPTPVVSSVNFNASGEATNLVTVPTGPDGMICVFASIATQVVIDEFATLQAPGLAKRLIISGAVPFPTFDATGLDYAMICPAGGADLTIDAVGTAQVGVTIDGTAATGAVTKHLGTDGLTKVKFTRGAVSSEYALRCLPPDFPPYKVDRPGSPQPGWYIGGMGWSAPPTSKFIVILDNHGAVVWYKRTDNQFVLDAKPWPGGNIAWTPQLGAAFGEDPNRGYRVNSLDGSLVAEYKTKPGTPTDHHDMVSLPDGGRAMITYVQRNNVNLTALQPAVTAPGVTLTATDTAVDSDIEEFDANGDLGFEWKSDEHFDPLETAIVPQRFVTPTAPAPGGIDLLHINSIDHQPDGDYIVSARHLDAVFRIDYPSGTVLWKLGGNNTPNHDGAVHMTILNDPLNGPKRMHDARLNANGVLTMFDNQSGTGHAPRVVAYQIDETAHTATFLWQRPYPNPAASSFGLGSARLTPEGSVVISWGVLQPMLEELDAQGNRLLAVTDAALGAISYRFIKEPPATFDRQVLQQTAGGNVEAP